MDFESKITSREISQLLWEREETLGTAESCTGGRIAGSIIAVPGASKYFKGGIVSYTNEVKESLLGVSHQLLEEKTAVCEEVAIAMVEGTKEIPVGTIWVACGSVGDVRTLCVCEDHGRDINLAIATNRAMQLFLEYIKEKDTVEHENKQ